jgi:hypothetical protein
VRGQWVPIPYRRGQVWLGQFHGKELEVRRMEEGFNTFGGIVNGVIIGAWDTPMRACEAVEQALMEMDYDAKGRRAAAH